MLVLSPLEPERSLKEFNAFAALAIFKLIYDSNYNIDCRRILFELLHYSGAISWWFKFCSVDGAAHGKAVYTQRDLVTDVILGHHWIIERVLLGGHWPSSSILNLNRCFHNSKIYRIAGQRAHRLVTGQLHRVHHKNAASPHLALSESFPCPHCGRPFSTKGNLKQHISTVHLQIKPFQCHKCWQKFSTRQTLERHLISSRNRGACFSKKSL